MITSGEIEFGVAAVERCEGERVIIAGRCYKGPIHVGDVFTAGARLIEAPPGESPRRSALFETSLSVAKIEAYGSSLSDLDEGMTARLILEGLGGAALKPEMVIIGDRAKDRAKGSGCGN